MWRDLGSMSLSPAVTAMVVAGSDDELAGLDMAETVQRRDDVLVRLLQMKEAAKLP
jgi:hypothetical protein